jgi:hypothetical protein
VLSGVGTEGALRQTKGQREAGTLLGTGVENAGDSELDRFQESLEIAWKDLIQAMETLLAALP